MFTRSAIHILTESARPILTRLTVHILHRCPPYPLDRQSKDSLNRRAAYSLDRRSKYSFNRRAPYSLARGFCVAWCWGGGHVKWCHEVAKPVRVGRSPFFFPPSFPFVCLFSPFLFLSLFFFLFCSSFPRRSGRSPKTCDRVLGCGTPAGSARFGAARPGWVRLGSAGLDWARLGWAWLDWARPVLNSACLGSARLGSAWCEHV